MKWYNKIIFAFLLVSVSLAGRAQQIPARPNPPRLVNDFAGVLSPQQEQQLESQLVSYDDTTSNQVAIVLVKSLNDYPIEEYALRLFRDWGIGNKKTNNGVLILAAIDDRKIRIEVGYGLEGAIPDITANHIIQNEIGPNFRSGDYYEGLSGAANSIIKAAAGEYTAPKDYRGRGSKGGGGARIGFIFIMMFMIILFIKRGGGRGGGGGGFMSRRGYRGGWLGPFILGNILGRSGGGGWGSGGGGGGWSGGGGGFGGFGGGSSGGGGASGSW